MRPVTRTQTADYAIITPAVNPYHLVQLHRDQPQSLVWFDVAINRIVAMSHRMGGNATLLKEQVWDLYAKGSPLQGLWLAFKDDQIVGHALGHIQSWDGRPVAWINQVEMDTVAGRALKDAFLQALESWARTVNRLLKETSPTPTYVHEILMVTRRTQPATYDHWSRHAGFDPYLAVYRREIKEYL